MPTYHPAYVQRIQYSPTKKYIKDDFERDIMTVGKAAGFIVE